MSFADIFEKVSPAVVSIRVTSKVDVSQMPGMRGIPGIPGLPFNLVPPGAMYGDRVEELDLRLGKRLRFGSLHVGFETAEPEQAGRRAGKRAHRDGAPRFALANVQEFQAVIVHLTVPTEARGSRDEPVTALCFAANAAGAQAITSPPHCR